MKHDILPDLKRGADAPWYEDLWWRNGAEL